MAHSAPQHPVETGLPQLDFSTFTSQIVWLVLSFALLYFLLSRFALPEIGAALERRRQKIEGDLHRAEVAQKHAAKAQLEYETALKEARSKAQTLIAEASALVEKDAASRRAEQTAEIKERLDAAEDAIAHAKSSALSELEPLARDLTKQVLAQVAKLSVSDAEVDAVLRVNPLSRAA